MQKPAWSIGARTGPVRKYVELVVFACEGLICIIDERPGKNQGDCSIVTPAELEERVKAINIPYRGQTREDLPRRIRDRHDKRVRGSQNCMECIKEARAMGDPSDPKVQEYWRRHRSSNMVSMTFSDGSLAEKVVHANVISGRGKPFDGKLATQIPAAPRVPELFKPPKRKQASKLVLPD